ncbi:MAG TPA: hypothetical protein VFE63_13760 [Roseiarcus sp.]|jgi:hypothetical protein|nr:hypothetical protein [Roseiarcus sp.]
MSGTVAGGVEEASLAAALPPAIASVPTAFTGFIRCGSRVTDYH